MQNSISSALPKIDGSVKSSAQGGTAGYASSAARANNSDTPFNQLLSTAQGAVPSDDVIADDAEMSSDDKLSADVDIFSDSLLDMGFGGTALPKYGQELPLSDQELRSLALTEDRDDSNVLVTWQQSQIDWSRQSNLLGSNSAANANAAVNVASMPLDTSEDLSAALLANNEKSADSKLNASVISTTASDLSKPTTGFATAMQLSSAATSAPLVKAANQAIELTSDSMTGFELSSASQTRTVDSSAARAPVALTVTQNALNDPAWAQAMSAKISWMAGNGVHTATMQLHPAELGSIHIQLSVNGDTTSVQIQAQQKDTSDLMEKMMPRLHSGMENQGLRLEEAKVTHNPNLNDGAATNAGQQFAGQSAGDRSGAANNGRDANQTGLDNNLDGDDASLHGALNASVTLQNSGVDYYA